MKRRWMVFLMALAMLAGAQRVQAGDVPEEKAAAVYESGAGKLEIVDYEVSGKVLALVVEYTNTTDENVSPGWKMLLSVFQNGIEMEHGRSFEVEGVRSEYTEIRPGAKLRYAEFFELDNAEDPVEVEISPVFSWNDDPMYVNLDLDSGKVIQPQEKGKQEKGERGGILGGVMDAYQDAYDEVMDEYSKAYDEVMDEYSKVIDEYANSLGSLFDSLGK